MRDGFGRLRLGMETDDDREKHSNSLVKRAEALLSNGGTLESSAGSGPIQDTELTRNVAAILETDLDKQITPGSPGPAEMATAKRVVDTARSALLKGKKLSEEDLSALELIVRTVGRPALRFRDGRLETPPNQLGDNSRWFVLVAQERERIDRLATSVGRIYAASEPGKPVLGTGWRIGPDMILTNRHVAKHLVVDPATPPETWKVNQAKQPFVDFAYTDGTTKSQHFNLGDLLFCACANGPDMAIFKVLPGNARLPTALPIDWSEAALGQVLQATENSLEKFQGEEMYAVGHPYWPSANEEARKIYGHVDGRKRWSPGLVTSVERHRPVLLHDSSTLAGNSGSCIVIVGPTGHTAVGLHFSGKELTAGVANALGSTNYAIAFARLGIHPAVEFLKRAP
jgi:hypothetical protein